MGITESIPINNSTWKCPECFNDNNIDKSKCFKCNCFRSKSKSLNLLKGDWQCKCGEINFREREICRKCNENKRILSELWCYETVNINAKTITLFYEDYNCNADYLKRIIGNKTVEECVEYIFNKMSPEYTEYTLIFDGFKLDDDIDSKDHKLVSLLINKFHEKIEFKNCYNKSSLINKV
jgi:hypothetical protein